MKKRYNLLVALVFSAFMGYSQTATLPISANFETEANNTSCSATIPLINGSFNNVSTDGASDWNPDVGGTSSSNTGPSIDVTLGTGAGKYLYTETSGCNNRTVNLESVYMNWSSFQGVKIEFWYHMFGTSMGTMHFDIRQGSGAWQQDFITSWTDNQDLWQLRSISVFDTAYAGQDSVQVRIRAQTGTSFGSDMAIDEISINPIVSRNLAAAGLTSPNFPFCAGPALAVAGDFMNDGTDTITSFMAYRSLNGVIDSVSFAGSLAPGDTTNVVFPNYTFASGVVYDLMLYTANPNGMADQSPGDDTISVMGARTGLPGGAYTLNPANPSSGTNFVSFADLSNTLSNFGICGPVTVNVAAGTYTDFLTLGDVVGTDSINKVTIDGGSLSTTTLDGSANFYTVAFDGAKYITVKNFTILNNAGSTMAVLFGNGAEHNTVSDCEIKVNVGSTSSLVNAIGMSSSLTGRSTGASAHYNTIENNRTVGGYYGMYCYGSSTNTQIGTRIIGNQIDSSYYYGVYAYYQDQMEVSGNHMDLSVRGNTFADGVYGFYNTNGIFTGNYIHAGDYGFYIYNASTQASPTFRKTQIINNMIIADTDYGLRLYSVDQVNLFHNSITTAGTFSPALEIAQSNTYPISSYDMRNNIFASVSTEALEIATAPDTIFIKSDNNAYYTATGATLIRASGTNYVDLASYQLIHPLYNTASVEGDPQFLSATDLHVIGGFVNDIGDNSTGVLTDIDGDTRPFAGSTVVDLGADEFSPPACLPVNNLSAANTTLTSADIFWAGNNPLNSWQYEFMTAGTPQGSGTIAITAVDSLTVTGLTASTSYSYYVREICGRGDTSLWIGPYTFRTSNGIPYVQNFDNFGTSTSIASEGWSNARGTSNPDWRTGSSTSSSGTGALNDNTTGSGLFAYIETSGGTQGNADTMYSAPVYVDTSQATFTVEFFYHMFGADIGTLSFYVEGASGARTLLGSITGAQQTAQADPWLKGAYSATGFGGQSVRLLVVASKGGTSFRGDICVDDIRLYVPAAQDGGVTDIFGPNSGCGLSATDTVTVEITNNGTAALSNFPVTYVLNSGTPVTETYTGSLAVGGVASFSFNTTVNLSAPGTYDLVAYTDIVNDGDTTNDTSSVVINSIPVLNTFPYTEGFESGNGGWVAGGTTSFALGTPTGAVINSAAGGTQSWVTNLTGNYNANEEGYVQGPCFDFTNVPAPQFKADIWWSSEFSWDGAALQSSIDGGTTWQNVGAFGDPNNWYNDNTINGMTTVSNGEGWTGTGTNSSGSWVLAEHDLTGLGGNSGVLLRVAFGSDGSGSGDGFAFDNILVQNAPAADAGVVEIVSPNNGCGLGAADTVEIRVINAGGAFITNFPVNYVVNAGTPVTETYADTLFPGDTGNYVFTTTVNLSVTGTYSLLTYTSLAADGNNLNDTLAGSVTNIPILSSFPYTEGFEAGNGGWTTGGTTTFALGAPAGSIINSAGGGTQSWVTNLTGNHNSNEDGYVQGPCFDFTNLAAPQFKMNVWWNSENSWDGAVLQTSIDGGASWQNVGAFGDPNNWYTDNSINALAGIGTNQDGWTGRNSSSNGSGSWVLAEHDLVGLGGVSAVLIRVVFASDGFVEDEGFAFDDVLIQNAPANDVGVVSIDAPMSGCNLGAADTVKISISNFGSAVASNFPVSYVFNAATAVTETFTDSIQPGDTAQYIFTTATVNVSTFNTNYTLDAYTALAGDGNVLNDTLRGYTIDNNTQSFPFNENFDALGSGQQNNFSNGWVGTNTSTFAWRSNVGGTGSTGTGPLSDHTTGSGTYMYTEASSGSTGSMAWLESPCIDLTANTTSNLRLSYWYHMYGATISALVVEMDSAGTWVLVDTIIGQQQIANSDPYYRSVVDVSSLAGLSQTKLRFAVDRGTSFTGDVSIDDVVLDDSTTIGLTDEVKSNAFSLYPNPSNGEVTLTLNTESSGAMNINVKDISGKVVYQNTINVNGSYRNTFDFSDFAKGVYFMQIQTGDAIRVEKLIIQ